MREDIAMEWADMLDSGIIKQGKNLLENEGKYCCLGVLCRIVEKRVGLKVTEPIEKGRDVLFNDECAYLPAEVIDYTKMHSDDGTIPSRDINLSLMNDNGKSFKQIAKIIRTNYKDL